MALTGWPRSAAHAPSICVSGGRSCLCLHGSGPTRGRLEAPRRAQRPSGAAYSEQPEIERRRPGRAAVSGLVGECPRRWTRRRPAGLVRDARWAVPAARPAAGSRAVSHVAVTRIKPPVGIHRVRAIRRLCPSSAAGRDPAPRRSCVTQAMAANPDHRLVAVISLGRPTTSTISAAGAARPHVRPDFGGRKIEQCRTKVVVYRPALASCTVARPRNGASCFRWSTACYTRVCARDACGAKLHLGDLRAGSCGAGSSPPFEPFDLARCPGRTGPTRRASAS